MNYNVRLPLCFFLLVAFQYGNAQFPDFFKRKRKEKVGKESETVNEVQYKIWEDSRGKSKKYEVGTMIAYANRTLSRNPDSKEWNVGSHYRQPGGTVHNISFKFHGECAEQVIVTGTLSKNWYRNQSDPQKIPESGKASDLPHLEYLEPIMMALKDQCDQLKSVQLKLKVSRNYVYEGQLDKENGWKLMDGLTHKSYSKKLNIHATSFLNTNFFASYIGGCENNITVDLKGKTNNPLHMKYASFSNYGEIIKNFGQKLSAECPSVERINFKLQYMPDGWQCKAGTECTLVANKNSGWSISKENLIRKGSNSISSRFSQEYKNTVFDFKGGQYLFAIHTGDYEMVRKMDAGYLKSFNDTYKKMDEISKTIFPGLSSEHSSMLPIVMTEYMHEYKNNPKPCFREGFKVIRFERTTETIQVANGFGQVTDEFGGIDQTGYYVVNEEFVELCKKYAGVRTWVNDYWSNHEVSKGVRTLRATFDCQSEEIRQFENNLIKYFKKFYERQ